MRQNPNPAPPILRRCSAFTLVELLVVIAIISILLTLATTGLNNLGGKPVATGVSTAEGIFNEARSLAMSKGVRAAVLVAKDLPNAREKQLRQLFVAHEEVDPVTGKAVNAASSTPDWVVTSRGALLPEGVYFSELLSKVDMTSSAAGGSMPEIKIKSAKAAMQGTYAIYVFNAEGISTLLTPARDSPNCGFIIGSGVRNNGSDDAPKVRGSGKADFGGFAITRYGRAVVVRTPGQISKNLPTIGQEF